MSTKTLVGTAGTPDTNTETTSLGDLRLSNRGIARVSVGRGTDPKPLQAPSRFQKFRSRMANKAESIGQATADALNNPANDTEATVRRFTKKVVGGVAHVTSRVATQTVAGVLGVVDGTVRSVPLLVPTGLRDASVMYISVAQHRVAQNSVYFGDLEACGQLESRSDDAITIMGDGPLAGTRITIPLEKAENGEIVINGVEEKAIIAPLQTGDSYVGDLYVVADGDRLGQAFVTRVIGTR